MQNTRATPPNPVIANTVLLLKRSLRVDMSPGELRADEKAAFDIENIHHGNPLLKQLLAWRRAALLLAFLLSVLPVAFNFVRALAVASDDKTHATLGALTVLTALANLLAFGGLWWAYTRWDHWPRSRRILLGTWLVGFATPFLVALYPVRSLAGGFAMGNTEVLLGMAGALAAIIDLAPRALSLVPGIIRAAFMTKVLLPESRFGAWLVQLAAPFYMLLVIVVLLVPYQLAGGGLMAPALFALLAAPIFMWRAGRKMLTLDNPEDVQALIRNTRITSLVFNTIGGIFAFMGLIDALGELDMNWTDAVLPVIALVANVFVVSVLCLDFLVQALMRHHALVGTQISAPDPIGPFITALQAERPSAPPAPASDDGDLRDRP